MIKSFSHIPAPKKEPTVRWRDMSSTIPASRMRKQNAADPDVEENFADESDANKDGEESDSEEPEDKDDGFETVDGFQGKAFDISRTINLGSGDLADVLSERLTSAKETRRNEDPRSCCRTRSPFRGRLGDVAA